MSRETAAVSARSVYTIQPCPTSTNDKFKGTQLEGSSDEVTDGFTDDRIKKKDRGKESWGNLPNIVTLQKIETRMTARVLKQDRST